MRSKDDLSSASESIQLEEINLGRTKFKFYVANMRSRDKLISASKSIQLGEINLGRPKFKFYVAYARYG